MRSHWITALVIALAASAARAQERGQPKEPVKSQPTAAPKTLKERVSYGIGLSIGKDMKRQAIDVDLAQLVSGLKDSLSDSKPLLTDAEIREAMGAFEKELKARQAERGRELAASNKKEGEAFLAENKKKQGVKTAASGLQYKVIKEGKGKVPKPADTVTVHYRGTLIDGTEFDSSYGRGEPASFPVNGVIKGWTEALQLMAVGSKWQLFIPANLAYGEKGAGTDIGPNAVLIFDVELIAIK
ncbi:MAG: FKBP-type peptidyl-prolyl cis-trans isomerase [Planctomycetes bacterium]|nr:FKBP-type peptidyl-prolyl cis-trans isomerase [Planctomycetota bacterium]